MEWRALNQARAMQRSNHHWTGAAGLHLLEFLRRRGPVASSFFPTSRNLERISYASRQVLALGAGSATPSLDRAAAEPSRQPLNDPSLVQCRIYHDGSGRLLPNGVPQLERRRRSRMGLASSTRLLATAGWTCGIRMGFRCRKRYRYVPWVGAAWSVPLQPRLARGDCLQLGTSVLCMFLHMQRRAGPRNCNLATADG